jgi:3-hydroxyisobutyrate dehydrogenase
MLRPKSVSFIGLGRMGSEMAFNLFSKKFAETSDSRFVVCDAIPSSARSFRDNFLAQFPGANMTIAVTPEECVFLVFSAALRVHSIIRAVLASQTVITMLPSSPQVQTVYSQSQGIIPALRTLPQVAAQHTLCIDSTTLDVAVAREVAEDVVRTGAQIVDAPVSGGTRMSAATIPFV